MPTLRTLLAIMVVALALPVIWFFAPVQLHGHTGYVIIDGISMEPNLHRGDLGLLQEASSYEVGDVVAYRSKELDGVIVLHRIHQITADGHYIFKGDNNDFLDGAPYPTVEELIGKEWAVIPKAGSVLLWIKDPMHAVIIGGIALALGLFSASVPSERRRRRSEGGLWQPLTAAGPSREQLILTPLAIAAVGLGIWLIAVGAPATKTVVERDLYTGNLTYSWRGKARESIAYPSGVAKTGDTVFAALVPRLTVGYDFELGSTLPLDASGKAGLNLDLSSDAGWHSIRTLAPARAFKGTRASAEGTIDFAQLERLARAIDAETGVESRSYTVTVVPNLAVRTKINGQVVRDTVSSPLRFNYDRRRLMLDTAPISETEENSTVRTISGAGQVERKNSFDIGVAKVSIPTARTLGGGAALLGFLGFLAMIVLVLRRGQQDEPTKLNERYGDLLVPVKRMPRTQSVVTDVESFRSLLRLAERHGTTIMHLENGAEHTYLLKENGLLYRYTVQGSGDSVPAPGVGDSVAQN